MRVVEVAVSSSLLREAWRIGRFGLAGVLLCACGDPIPTEGGPAAAVATTAAAGAEESVAVVRVDEYFYNPASKRDPFKPFYDTRKTTTDPVNPDTPPLQRWDVDKFILSGVIWNTAIPRALLVDPEGTGHVI